MPLQADAGLGAEKTSDEDAVIIPAPHPYSAGTTTLTIRAMAVGNPPSW
jgi:hypothetical protein